MLHQNNPPDDCSESSRVAGGFFASRRLHPAEAVLSISVCHGIFVRLISLYIVASISAIAYSDMNDVTFIQFGAHWKDDSATEKTLSAVQASGVCWMGGAEYNGKFCIRICVCSCQIVLSLLFKL